MSEFSRKCECGRDTKMYYYYKASKNGKENGKFDIFSEVLYDTPPEGYEYVPQICNPGCEKNVGDDGVIR